MKLLLRLAVLATAAALLAGCGSSSNDESTQTDAGPTQLPSTTPEAPPGASVKVCDTYAGDVEDLRVTGVACGEARDLMSGWQRAESCGLIGAASRGSCSVDSYRCISSRAGDSIAVNCAAPQRSISFVVKRG